MVEPTITYCEQCGGVKSMYYPNPLANATAIPFAPLATAAANQWMPTPESIQSSIGAYTHIGDGNQPLTYTLCFGHPEQPHNGKLDDYLDPEGQFAKHHATIDILPEDIHAKHELVRIYGGYGDSEACLVYLDAKQFLEAMKWGEQNKLMLERMANEASR